MALRGVKTPTPRRKPEGTRLSHAVLVMGGRVYCDRINALGVPMEKPRENRRMLGEPVVKSRQWRGDIATTDRDINLLVTTKLLLSLLVLNILPASS